MGIKKSNWPEIVSKAHKETYKTIAKDYGVSIARIGQICSKSGYNKRALYSKK